MGPESNRGAQFSSAQISSAQISSAQISSAQISLDQVSITLGLSIDRRGKVLRPGMRVIESCSWAIQAGERWALTGPSGSGKTTLLRLFNRLIDPTQGQVQWRGVPYRQLPIAELRRQILYVPQEPRLFGMCALDAIAYPLKLQGRASSEITQRCSEVLDQLEIPALWLEQPEVQLSQNQRQWVALARALALQPEVLLLDQPTALLDPTQIECLQRALDHPSHSVRTLIITGYSPETLSLMTHRCYRLADRQGSLLRSGSAVGDSIDESW